MTVERPFDKLGFALVMAGAGAAAVVYHRPELLDRIPMAVGTLDVMFVGVALAVVGVVALQLQTFLTPTPGRVSMTAGLVAIVVTFLDYAPPLTFVGGLVLLAIGALLRQAEVIAEVSR